MWFRRKEGFPGRVVMVGWLDVEGKLRLDEVLGPESIS